MRTLSRALTALAATAVVVPLWPLAAHADQATDTAASTAYYSELGTPRPALCLPPEMAPPVLPPPVPPIPPCVEPPSAPPQVVPDSQLDGVGPGNLGVAGRGATETKVSFVFFSLSTIPTGSEITRAVMTVPLAPADSANRQENAKATNVRACAPDDSGFGGQDGNSLTEAPERLCDKFSADATATPDGSAFVFDISALASTWDEANNGVALTRTANAESSFQAVFLPAATLSFEYTPPPAEDLGDTTFDEGTVEFGDSGDTSLAGLDGGFTGDVGSGDSGSFAGGALPATAPQAAAVDQPAVAAVPRSAPGPLEILSLTPSFWLAALLVVATLGFLSLVLGDRRTPLPAAAAARPSRLSRALVAAPGQRPSLLGSRGA